MAFALDAVIPWGRSYEEYLAMFAMSQADLDLTILGCGDGPAAFNAGAHQRQHKVISIDPIYEFSTQQIQARIDQAIPLVETQLVNNPEAFVWRYFPSVADLVSTRKAAMTTFLEDLPQGRVSGRYIPGALPNLPFDAGRFDLALCSHFLFLYSEQYALDFHIDSLVELARVAREVRIFPLLELGSIPSRHLPDCRSFLMAQGLETEICTVDYEFQRGGNRMLRIWAH